MRASRILATRPDRAIIALAELCDERLDELSPPPQPYVPPRLVSSPHTLPPQTPYTVGSHPMRSKAVPISVPGTVSPPQVYEPGPRLAVHQVSAGMEPKRGKWTSPPPPEAPSSAHTLFDNQLGMGLELATAATDAREMDRADHSSSNSETFTDDDAGESDDVQSVQSYTEGSTTSSPSGSFRRPSWMHPHDPAERHTAYSAYTSDIHARMASGSRGRLSPRVPENGNVTPVAIPPRHLNDPLSSSRNEINRRSLSGPPRRLKSQGSHWSQSLNTPTPLTTPLPPSPDPHVEPETVFYQTTATRSPRPNILYPTSGSGLHSSYITQYQRLQYQSNLEGATTPTPQDVLPSNQPPSLTSTVRNATFTESATAGRPSRSPETPTPMSYSHSHSSHSHSLSTSTITPLTPPSHETKILPPQSVINSSPLISGSPPLPVSTIPPFGHGQRHLSIQNNGADSPHASSTSNGSSPPSSTGYLTSISRSPSPSPSPPTSKSAPDNAIDRAPTVSKESSPGEAKEGPRDDATDEFTRNDSITT